MPSLARAFRLLPILLAAAGSSAGAQDLLDLALRYQRLEAAYALGRVPEADRPEIHRAADGVARAFFAGRTDTAIERLDRATLLALRPEAPDDATLVALAGLRVALDETDRLVLRATRPLTASRTVRLAWRAGADAPTTAVTLDGAGPWIVEPPEGVRDGRTTIAVRLDDGTDLPLGPVTRGAAALPAARAALTARLDAVAGTDDLAAARRIAASRLAALVPSGPRDVTAWTLDRVALRAALDAEIARLEQGVDPYRADTLPAASGRDLWLRLPLGDPRAGGVPCRLVLPPSLDAERPAPLLVALHGAGGNEHLFIDGHGDGALPRLAAAHGAIVLAPATLGFMRPDLLPATIDLLAARWPVDRDRVVLLGHSLGAATAIAIAARHPDLVHAACGIAGAGPATAAVTVPLRLYGAAADQIVPCASVRASAEAARAAGRPCEYVEIAEAGHLMVVADVLPEAVDWLLSDRAASPTDGPSAAPSGPPAADR